MESHEKWLDEAIRMATENVAAGGGPFAALVVRNGQVIATGVNDTARAHDPTAHAELLAIRAACERLQTTDLSDCIVYASGEPCPMCMGAAYWTKLGTIYFACSKREANEAVGFADPLANFYADLSRPPASRAVPVHKLDAADRLKPFYVWRDARQC